MNPKQQLRTQDRSAYLSDDTIAAIATAVGGPITLIRVSGPNAKRALTALAPTFRIDTHEDRRLVVTPLHRASGQRLDEAMVVVFTNPRSYTGEDCVEFQIHGGAFLATELMKELKVLGVRQALPGEFSFRAVRNGKMDLTQAQAVSDLIGAKNFGALDLALVKMSGSQAGQLTELAESLRHLLMLAEAGVDFSDQDIEEVSLARLSPKVTRIAERLRSLAASFERGTRIQEGLTVSLLGAPNVGKSSFFNALLGQDRSIVSELAGTTRDVVHESVTLSSSSSQVTLRLSDTAGVRVTRDPIEQLGLERTLKAASLSDLLLVVVGPGSEPEPDLLKIWNDLGRPSHRAIGIRTKCDLLNQRPTRGWSELGISDWFDTSAKTGEGIQEAAAGIADFCSSWVRRDPDEILLTHQSQLLSVQEAISHLNRAVECRTTDLFASDLKHALGALEQMVGKTLPDDILGRIFSSFCIGK